MLCRVIAYDMFRMLKADGIMKISFNDLISKFEKSNLNIYPPFNKIDIEFIKMKLKLLGKISFIEITDYEFSIPIRRLEELRYTNTGITIKEIREMNRFYKDPDSVIIRMENFDSLLSSINGLFIQYKDEFENLYKCNIIRYNQNQIDKYRDFIELYMELSKIYHEKIDWYNKCYYQRLVDLSEREPDND